MFLNDTGYPHALNFKFVLKELNHKRYMCIYLFLKSFESLYTCPECMIGHK